LGSGPPLPVKSARPDYSAPQPSFAGRHWEAALDGLQRGRTASRPSSISWLTGWQRD
jgi:hypothetical protein